MSITKRSKTGTILPIVTTKAKDTNVAVLKMSGLNDVQIAKETNLTRKTVKVILDKPSIRQMMIDAFTEHKFTLSMLAKKNIDMLSAERYVFKNGNYKKVADNVAQVAAMKEMNSIYGVYAPKQLDIRASATEASLEELTDQVDAALEELDMGAEQSRSLVGNDSTE